MREDRRSVVQLRGASRIGAALREGLPIGLVLVQQGAAEDGVGEVLEHARARGIPVRAASAAVIRRMTSVGPPSQILALVGRMPGADLEAALARRGAVWLLVGASYPSNAGMVIRTAEGSGAEAVAIDADWDHVGRRTALRTSMRSDWYMPVLWERAEHVVERARNSGHRIFGIENTGTKVPWDVDLSGPALLVVGGEGHGIPRDLLERCDEVLRIPMAGFIPSYNVQAAVSVVSVERLRQLAVRPGGQRPNA